MTKLEKRLGQQTPTVSFTIPYKETKGDEAIDIYNRTTRQSREWQEVLLYDIMAVDDEGLWTHSKYGYSVPRRNGKSEILAIRELWGLVNGEKILHTAHRTSTSHGAWELLCLLLDEAGIEYHSTKQFGLETISTENGGKCNFRTRSSKILGEGFDCLIIDEAQEYTIDHESALKYMVTQSENPQTILCGTPPTAVSVGTVFADLRDTTLSGHGYLTGWSEWSVPHMADVENVDLWYETNPSLGQGLSERNVRSEITTDTVDFNIQRLGLWLTYNQKSAFSRKEWKDLKTKAMPNFSNPLFIGIKYAYDGSDVSLSVATRLDDGAIFVEAIDCQPQQAGNEWIIDFLKHNKKARVIVDGKAQYPILTAEMKEYGLKKAPELIDTQKFIVANALFERAVYDKEIAHNAQPSLVQAVANSEKRVIGNAGGFGFRPLKAEISPSLMDSVILANYLCNTNKARKKQTIRY